MRLFNISSAVMCYSLGVHCLTVPQPQFERCSSLLCTCDFGSAQSGCATEFCNSLSPSAFGSSLSCANDFLNTAAGTCCSASDPAACLSEYQQSSSACQGGKGSVEELRRRHPVDNGPDDRPVVERQDDYTSYSTGASYDEDMSGCTWNFDGASTAGACDTPDMSNYGGGGSYDDITGSDSESDSGDFASAAQGSRVISTVFYPCIMAVFFSLW